MSPTSQTILIVDDETYVLRSLQRVLRHENYQVLTVTSGSEALKILEQESVDLIVSDLRMPGMDGSELLGVVAELYPGMPRILLSGNADLPAVIKTVNEGQLSYYFQKPWDDDAIRLTLRGFLERKKLQELERTLTSQIQQQNEELKELNEKLAKQSELILKESEIKSRFFSTMSHEIRTPLNGLLGVLQIMNEDDSDALQTSTLLKTCYATAQDLKRIADDVLDYSKLESNKMELESIPFQVNDCLSPILTLTTPMADAKGVTLELITDLNSDITLTGDPLRVRQIISNLVSNAIKYTEKGSVEIASNYHNNELTISVADTGIGISAQRSELLFQEFQMLDPAHHRKYGGTGLGLSIAKRLVEQMSGTISVQSVVGEGSCFTVVLPLAISQSLSPETSVNLDLSDKRCLIVDDNEANILIVKAAVEKLGAYTETAMNGLSAIGVLQSSAYEFDIILLDINMPVLDGVETLKIIRDDQLATCPVYALTAQLDDNAIERFETAGFDRVLPKPIDLAELCAAIAQTETESPRVFRRPFCVSQAASA